MNAFQKYAAKRLLVANLIEKLAAHSTVHHDFTKKKGDGSTIIVGKQPKYSKDTQAMFDMLKKFTSGMGKTTQAVFKPHPSMRRRAESPVSPFGRKPVAAVKPVVNPVKPVATR